METLEVGSTLVPETSTSKRRRKKGRIVQKGYHKSQRADARRVAAKEFLSGIVLDSNYQARRPPRDSGDVSTLMGHEFGDGAASRPISAASRHSNALFLGDEYLHVNTDVSGEGRLYEIALDNLPQLQHQSPSKIQPSKSLDYSFGSYSPALSQRPVVLNHSVSMFESQSDRKQANILVPAHKRWQTMDNSPTVHYLNTLLDTNAEWLMDSRSVDKL